MLSAAFRCLKPLRTTVSSNELLSKHSVSCKVLSLKCTFQQLECNICICEYVTGTLEHEMVFLGVLRLKMCKYMCSYPQKAPCMNTCRFPLLTTWREYSADEVRQQEGRLTGPVGPQCRL